MRINVLGVGFDNVTMKEAVARGTELLGQPGAHYVVTPNPEIVEVCRENPEAMRAVNGADLVLADGVGVVKGARMLGTPLKAKVPGIEFAAGLMEEMAAKGMSLYLLGAKPGVAETAEKRLAEKYPGLTIAGTHDGYFQDDGPVIEVLDTGQGMTQEEIKKITQPFYRVDKSRSRRFGGVGLGLAIVSQIVELHGGRLAIDSVPGQGTRVRIYFTDC